MKLVLCSVFDKAAEAYGRPIAVTAPGQALRSFIDEVNRSDKSTDLSRHPADFELFEVGSFDDATGRVVSDHAPVLIASGSQVVEA